MRRAAFLTTPAKISGEVQRFCQSLTTQPPQMIKAVPFPGCDGDDPAVILPGHIERFGGCAVQGWRILSWPRVMLHAEPHWVWHSPKDELIDVCATADRAGQAVFLAAEPQTIPTVQRLALIRDANLLAWLDLAAQNRESENQAMDLFLAVVKKHSRPGDPCWCGSGRQLRKCHPFQK